MKITAVILESLEKQRAKGDTEIIDPKGLLTRVPGSVSVHKNFNYDLESWLGNASNFRLNEEGDLIADLDVDLGLRLGVGGKVVSQEGNVITKLDLLEVSVLPAKRESADAP